MKLARAWDKAQASSGPVQAGVAHGWCGTRREDGDEVNYGDEEKDTASAKV